MALIWNGVCDANDASREKYNTFVPRDYTTLRELLIITLTAPLLPLSL